MAGSPDIDGIHVFYKNLFSSEDILSVLLFYIFYYLKFYPDTRFFTRNTFLATGLGVS